MTEADIFLRDGCYYGPGFSLDLNFQDVMTSKLKKFGRQCTKSGSLGDGLQDYLSSCR